MAKKLAAARGTSISAMFSQFIRALADNPQVAGKVGPTTRRLTGIAKPRRGKTDRQVLEDAPDSEIHVVSDIVFVDTNVLLDVLLAREPFLADAQRIWTLCERKTIRGVVSAASFLNVYYIVRRLASRREAERDPRDAGNIPNRSS